MSKKRIGFEGFLFDTTSPVPKKTPEEVAKLILSDDINDYDRKLIVNTVSEMYETARMMQDIRTTPKITVFGSARTKADHPDYKLCVEFGKVAASVGYKIITGAGPGIMEAAPEGAGAENSVGVSVELPFEEGVNSVIQESKHLITYKYFFTRKLAFVRESDAIVLFPGGFGTMDEAFETLCLLHTGRTMPVPLVLMDSEGSDYWDKFLAYIKDGLLDTGNISENDLYIFRRFHDATDAMDYINNFYRRYHSMRYKGNDVLITLNTPLPNSLREELEEEYTDFLDGKGIMDAEPPEHEPDLKNKPHILISPARSRPVDLYCLVRSLNREVLTSSTRRQDRSDEELSLIHKRPKRVKKFDSQ